MQRRSFVPPLSLLALAGCLQDGPAPIGVHLFHSQTLASPGFVKVGDEVGIRFQDRVAPATSDRGGIFDLWLTSLDGKEQRKFVTGVSDYWSEQGPFGAGDRYFMVNERLVPSTGALARVATLLRLGPTLEEEFRLEGIWAYQRVSAPLAALYAEAQDGQTCPGFPSLTRDCPQLIYERPALPGQSFPSLFLWDGRDEIPIGADAGSFQVQTMGNGRIYFIFESQRWLARLLRPQNTLELLRANVSRFMISGDEHYAAVAVADPTKARTVVLDMTTGAEIPLMRPNPSGWGGFGNDAFTYAQSATADAPAELHTLTLSTGEDKFDTLPKALVDLSGIVNRPGTDERLLLDSAGHGVFTKQSDFAPLRTALVGPLLTPSFTPDGSYLMYVAPAARTLYDTTLQGPLMFQVADRTEEPASMVSPAGLLIGAQNGSSYFFTDGDAGKILVFWAHLGRASSDLFFADYADGALPTNLRLMAKAILSVSVSAHGLFGIVDMSQQDGVGNLVRRDFDHGTETLYAHAVVDATESPSSLGLPEPLVAYIVRGRADSDRSGLWLSPVAQPVPPDGGTDK